MDIRINDYTVIFLSGASYSGKSDFAEKHFSSYEVFIDREPEFREAHIVLDREQLTKEKRSFYMKKAREHQYMRIAIVLDLPMEDLLREAEGRTKETVIVSEVQGVHAFLKKWQSEGFDAVYVINSTEEMEEVRLIYEKGIFDQREETGPFDLIGDVHGCLTELEKLLRKLGYCINSEGKWTHPQNRKAVLLGDMVDRGEDSVGVLRLVKKLCENHVGYAVLGNHDEKLLRYLQGNPVKVEHGMRSTAEQIELLSLEEKEELKEFLADLSTYYIFDGGSLVAVHAGIKEEYLYRYTKEVREFCLYGETSGEIDAMGKPVRLDWTQGYKGDAIIAYGHIPYYAVRAFNRTYGVDTGCIFNNYLSALRYPEMEVERVRKRK